MGLAMSLIKFYERVFDNFLSVHIRRSCREIEDGQTYFQTDDSREVYAKERKGSNIVVIFRKKSE